MQYNAIHFLLRQPSCVLLVANGRYQPAVDVYIRQNNAMYRCSGIRIVPMECYVMWIFYLFSNLPHAMTGIFFSQSGLVLKHYALLMRQYGKKKSFEES
jgi:hypothetical protein